MVAANSSAGYPSNINDPARILNAEKCEVAISNHFNAGGGTGVEVLYWSGAGAATRDTAARISAAIAAAYGITNRGAKPRGDLGIINQTDMTLYLIEWGFVDAPGNADVPKILKDPAKGINAALTALGVPQASTSPPQAALPSGTLYRVQIGAFSVKANADRMLADAKAKGFDVFIATSGNLFRVQIGAYSVKANAENMLAKAKAAGFKDAFIA